MLGAGIEPARPYDREILSLLRLPISPPEQEDNLIGPVAEMVTDILLTIVRKIPRLRPRGRTLLSSDFVRSGFQFCQKIAFAIFLRPGAELNCRIEILQISALPLGYQALSVLCQIVLFEMHTIIFC